MGLANQIKSWRKLNVYYVPNPLAVIQNYLPYCPLVIVAFLALWLWRRPSQRQMSGYYVAILTLVLIFLFHVLHSARYIHTNTYVELLLELFLLIFPIAVIVDVLHSKRAPSERPSFLIKWLVRILIFVLWAPLTYFYVTFFPLNLG